jgi:cell division protein FtsI/penicillin-binding protein 2
MNLTAAIANSCNSYFRMLTAGMRGADLTSTAKQFGFEPPENDLTGAALIGVGNQWSISPLHMALAYIELTRLRGKPGVDEILAGLAESAKRGTGAAVGRAGQGSALAKTGTAACTHNRSTPGDGFVIALVPAEQPEILLMVREHGVPGAKAAATAGRMLHSLGK